MRWNPWAQELPDTREHARMLRGGTCCYCGRRVRDTAGRYTRGTVCAEHEDARRGEPLQRENEWLRQMRRISGGS